MNTNTNTPATSDTSADKTKSETGAGAPMVVVVVVAIVILIAYAIFIYASWDKVGTDTDTNWTRRIMLFGGIEALAFAAAGWMFGREVGREAAKDAKADKDKAVAVKDQAVQRADDARTDAVQLASKITTQATSGSYAMSASSDINELAKQIEAKWGAQH